MDLKSMLSSVWFTRLVLVSCMISSISIYFVFKNMEFIVHGQLYDFGLVFSPEWADGYRVFTWLVFAFLSVPMILSGIALASSFLNIAEMPKKEKVVPQKAGKSIGVTKLHHVGSQPAHPVTPTPKVGQSANGKIKKVGSGNGNCIGISCPECKKVFGRALVMLDFRSGSNRLVSVCPYCNNVLGFTDEKETKEDNVHVALQDKRVTL